MKQISLWANQHRWLAIFIIIILKTTMGIAAFYLGQWLAEDGLLISPLTVYFLAAIFLLTIYVYPAFKRNYTFRKAADWVMMSCAFITVVTISNNINTLKVNTPFVQAAYNINPPVQRTVTTSTYKGNESLTKLEKKNLRKVLLKQGKFLSAFMLNRDPNDMRRIALIAVIIILALGAGFLLAGLVCNLSCNGSDTAAVLVGVFGLAGIIWGSIALFKYSQKKYPKAEPPPARQLPTEN